jgi:hypothetical protein
MPSDKFVVSDTELEPLTVTVEQTGRLTGESRSQIYNLIGCGAYQAVKSGRRTLILYDSVKRRQLALPRAKIKPAKPRGNAQRGAQSCVPSSSRSARSPPPMS